MEPFKDDEYFQQLYAEREQAAIDRYDAIERYHQIDLAYKDLVDKIIDDAMHSIDDEIYMELD